MKITLIKDTTEDEYRSISWKYETGDVRLDFTSEVNAIYSSKIDRIVVELFEDGKIFTYLPSGDIDREINIPTLDGYQFRGINKSNESDSGVSLLFFPISDNKGNQWNDIEQYELQLESQPLGEYLTIYR